MAFLVVGLSLLLVLRIIVGYQSSGDSASTENLDAGKIVPIPVVKTEAEAKFDALKPAEHLYQAKLSLKPNAGSPTLEDGLRHVHAIPQSAPEAAEARKVEVQLIRAQHLTTAQQLIDSASTDDLQSSHDALKRAGDEIQAVLQQNPKDRDALKLLTLATNKGKEALLGSRQTREVYAQQMQQRLVAMGFDMNVTVGGEGSTQGRELHVDSAMFKDTATRVEFISSVLPQWQKDLCKVGFRQVRLTEGGMFDPERQYRLPCRAAGAKVVDFAPAGKRGSKLVPSSVVREIENRNLKRLC